MLNRHLILLIFLISGYSQIALAAEIIVTDADNIWNLTLENATEIGRLPYGTDAGVMVVRYADSISYKSLDTPTDIGRYVGEPNVMIVRYADSISYKSFENPSNIAGRELGITIDSPHNGDLILASLVTVKGTASSTNGITGVKVNGVLATGTNSWSATVPMNNGINTINVEAITGTTYSDTKSIQVFHYFETNCDLNNNNILDSGDVTILMRKIVGLIS